VERPYLTSRRHRLHPGAHSELIPDPWTSPERAE
jgi:hypothetical protein